MTTTLAPASIAAAAAATRSALTKHGATRASSRGSSPTSCALCKVGSTRSGAARLPRHIRARGRRRVRLRSGACARRRSRWASCRLRRRRNCRCRRRGRKLQCLVGPCDARSPRRRSRRAATARGRSSPGRTSRQKRRRDQRRGTGTAARCGARAPIARSTAPASCSTALAAARAIARRRPASAKRREQRRGQFVRVAGQRGPAAGIEQGVDIGEIGHMRAVQDRACELGRLDRILTAFARQRFADQHDAGEPVEQPEFADRVADVDLRFAFGPLAARTQRARKAQSLQLRQDRLAARGVARRDQGQRVRKDRLRVCDAPRPRYAPLPRGWKRRSRSAGQRSGPQAPRVPDGRRAARRASNFRLPITCTSRAPSAARRSASPRRLREAEIDARRAARG